MNKKNFEPPIVKILSFKSNDVIATSSPTPGTQEPTDIVPGGHAGGHRVKGINFVPETGKVSWD